MKRSRQVASGFLLLEALVALALVGVALLLTMALLTAEARFRQARETRVAALEAAEDVLELLRSGYLAFEPTTLEHPELELLLDRPLPPITLWLEIEPSGVPGLYDVAVVSRFVAAGHLQRDRLPTRMRGP